MYRVFRVPSAQASRADVVWKDDLVSRQSITSRDAKSLGLPGGDRYVLVEGSDAGVARATELLKDLALALAGAEAERVYRQFRAQDEEAASGMGLIFGP
ncbi:MAG TPA: hypothetical protein VEN80_02895 [Thermoplasmata archaeon]|nr:hypothetical protein [Thermoplasmata archaeon]